MKIKDKEFNGLNIEYQKIFRNIKYPRLEFKTGKLILILPKNYKEEKKLIEKHKKWIYKKSLIINWAKKEAKNKKIKPKSEKELKKIVIKYVDRFSKEINVKVNKIYFKELKSKWGSCSRNRNLTFNTLMRFLPNYLIKYIVFHEVTHIKEKKHTEKFWYLISRKFKDYSTKEKELLMYWFLIQDIIDLRKNIDLNF